MIRVETCRDPCGPNRSDKEPSTAAEDDLIKSSRLYPSLILNVSLKFLKLNLRLKLLKFKLNLNLNLNLNYLKSLKLLKLNLSK